MRPVHRLAAAAPSSPAAPPARRSRAAPRRSPPPNRRRGPRRSGSGAARRGGPTGTTRATPHCRTDARSRSPDRSRRGTGSRAAARPPRPWRRRDRSRTAGCARRSPAGRALVAAVPLEHVRQRANGVEEPMSQNHTSGALRPSSVPIRTNGALIHVVSAGKSGALISVEGRTAAKRYTRLAVAGGGISGHFARFAGFGFSRNAISMLPSSTRCIPSRRSRAQRCQRLPNRRLRSSSLIVPAARRGPSVPARGSHGRRRRERRARTRRTRTRGSTRPPRSGPPRCPPGRASSGASPCARCGCRCRSRCPNRLRRIACPRMNRGWRYAAALFWIANGANHFRAPRFYKAIVPPPFEKRQARGERRVRRSRAGGRRGGPARPQRGRRRAGGCSRRWRPCTGPTSTWRCGREKFPKFPPALLWARLPVQGLFAWLTWRGTE